MTATEAESACQDLGDQWGLPDYQGYRKELTDYMASRHLTSIWLTLQKQIYDKWMWLNSTTRRPMFYLFFFS